MLDERKNPELLLQQIKKSEQQRTMGSLKIFFGYAAGVGKTYAMLKAAHDLKKRGVDIVVGYVEPHARPETLALVEGLECLPIKIVDHNGIKLKEFDLDAAIARKPEIILVDELAHTNAKTCRNEKRYQDVEELLKQGIDVYTTLNVQHIESLNDIVSSITGVSVRERIPDSFFDLANQIEIIDIGADELIDRLKDGKVYRSNQARRAMDNFFSVENLTALREIALRRCADHINNLSENTGIKQHDDYHTDEHILVCVSSSPSNAKIIRNAARMANAFKGNFTAVYVETSNHSAISNDDLNRLQSNLHLAEQLGAKIEILYGDDIPLQIAEFARLSSVSKVVIGRSAAINRHFYKQTLVEKLIAYVPQLDVFVIPDSANKYVYHREVNRIKTKFTLRDTVLSIVILIAVTLIGWWFKHMGFEEANIIMVYVLGVSITSIVTRNQIYSLLSSIASVLVFNFLFTEPYFSLEAYGPGYPVTFLVMFLSAFITSTLAIKLKKHAYQSAISAYRTKILLETNQALQKAEDQFSILDVTAKQLMRLIQRDIVVYGTDNGYLLDPKVYYRDENHKNDIYTSENEKAVALWVLKNNKHAGSTTQTLSNARCLYLAVRVNQNIHAVIGIALNKEPLEAPQKSIMLSILDECALALENDKNAREKEAANIIAKNEQLRVNLLRTISHDLRTPLTSISGNASNFLSNGDAMDEETKRQLFIDIYDDSMWLINLVENLLSVTKLEENRLNLNFTSELVADVVEESLKHISRKKDEHVIKVQNENELLLAQMDSRLIMQVIINIVNNAIKYTQVGSEIIINVKQNKNFVEISISDDGEGVKPELQEKIFDMFYTGNGSLSDSHRSLGLGLALCKSIITVHGGEIVCKSNHPHGTVFTFTLPIKEVDIHE